MLLIHMKCKSADHSNRRSITFQTLLLSLHNTGGEEMKTSYAEVMQAWSLAVDEADTPYCIW